MRIFLAIAWRNIMRNKKRSFITAFAIAFGLVALIFMWSLMDGIYPAMIDNMTSLYMGHMEISRPEYIDQPKLEYAVKDEQPVIDAVKNNENVAAYSPRLSLFGLVSYADYSQGAMVVGIEPELEASLGKLDSFVEEGRFITADDRRGAVVGEVLARNLDVRLGERIFFLTQGTRGELAYLNLDVVGLLKTKVPELDNSMVLVRRADLLDEEMLDMPAGFTTLAIRLVNQQKLEETKAELNAALPADIRARTWKEMAPFVEQAINMDTAFGYLLVFIMLVVVVAGILNTVLMSVMERTREFGIMRALGTKKRQVFTMVIIEATILGLVGLMTGLVVGIGLVQIFSEVGINLYGSFDESIMGQFYIDPVVYPLLDLQHLLTTCIAVMSMVIIVSLYPARKASRLEPITAIKTLG